MFRTRNRIIGIAMNRYPATPSARRAPGAPLVVGSSTLFAGEAGGASLAR